MSNRRYYEEDNSNSSAFEEGYSAGYEDGYRAALKTVNEYLAKKDEDKKPSPKGNL